VGAVGGVEAQGELELVFLLVFLIDHFKDLFYVEEFGFFVVGEID
jgi:hypothetical protein